MRLDQFPYANPSEKWTLASLCLAICTRLMDLQPELSEAVAKSDPEAVRLAVCVTVRGMLLLVGHVSGVSALKLVDSCMW